MDTQIYLRLRFLLADLVKFLCANLKELHSGKKTPGAYFVSHCFTLPEGNCNDCIRINDRSVEGKL